MIWGGHGPECSSVALVLLLLIWQFVFEVSDPKLRSGDRSTKNYCLTLLSISFSRSNFIFLRLTFVSYCISKVMNFK